MKSTNLLLIIFLLLKIPQNTYSQQWSVQLGGDRGDGSYTSTSTADGNTFIAGVFDGSNLITPIDTLYETTHGDLFLTQIDPNGNCLWDKQIRCTFLDSINHSSAYAIVLDEINQSIYVLFQTEGKIDIDTFTSLNWGNRDIALAKFDFNGNCIWLKSAGGVFTDIATGLTLDSIGDIYICGQNGQNANFDTITLASNGSFLAKYNTNGECLWAKTISNSGFQVNLLEYKNSRLIMTGNNFSDSTMVDTLLLLHPAGYNSFVITGFDLNGNVLWAKQGIWKFFSNSGVGDFNLDVNGNIYVGGYFKDTLDLEGNLFISNPGESAMFLIKLDSIGNFIWSNQINSIYSSIFSVSSSLNGNIYITGRLGDTAIFGNNTIIPNYPIEMFLAHYDSNGNFHGAMHYGEAIGSSVSQDGNENPYLITHFYNTVNNGIASYTSYGSSDILITKYNILDNIQNPERNGNSQLLIYANPNSGKCSIQIPDALQKESELELKIYSSTGAILQNKVLRLNAETISVDLEYEAAGIYLVTLSDGQRIYRGKIVFE